MKLQAINLNMPVVFGERKRPAASRPIPIKSLPTVWDQGAAYNTAQVLGILGRSLGNQKQRERDAVDAVRTDLERHIHRAFREVQKYISNVNDSRTLARIKQSLEKFQAGPGKEEADLSSSWLALHHVDPELLADMKNASFPDRVEPRDSINETLAKVNERMAQLSQPKVDKKA